MEEIRETMISFKNAEIVNGEILSSTDSTWTCAEHKKIPRPSVEPGKGLYSLSATLK